MSKDEICYIFGSNLFIICEFVVGETENLSLKEYCEWSMKRSYKCDEFWKYYHCERSAKYEGWIVKI